MAEEAKASPGKTPPPCEWPEGALDLLKQLTEGNIAVAIEVKLCRDFGFNCGAIAVISVEEFCECKFVIAF